MAQGMKTACVMSMLALTARPALAIDPAYLGVWAPSPQECTGDDRTAFRITPAGISGRELECEAKQESFDGTGWRVRLWCGQEGVDFDLILRWTLAPDGDLREVEEGGKSREYVRCKTIICDASRPWCAGSP